MKTISCNIYSLLAKHFVSMHDFKSRSCMTWSNQVDPNVVKAEVNYFLEAAFRGYYTQVCIVVSKDFRNDLEVHTDMVVYDHLYHKQ